MALKYQVVNVMGRPEQSVQVPLVDDGDKKDSVAHSPEWMVRLDNMLFSSVEEYKDYCALYGWHNESGRYTSGDISGQLFTSATLSQSDVVLVIPSGGYAASLQTRMNDGRIIERMTIVHLGNVEQVRVKLQETHYAVCRIQNYQQQLERVILHIQTVGKMERHFIYNQLGQMKGQMVTAVSYMRNCMPLMDEEGMGPEGLFEE